MSITVADLANKLGLSYTGESAIEINSVASFDAAGEGALAFLTSSKNISAIGTQSVLVTTQAIADQVKAKAYIISEHPQLSFAKAIELILPSQPQVAGIAASAVVDATAKIDPTASILANAVIEAGVVIQANTVIGANVFVGKNSQIGCDSVIEANVSIYADTEIGRDCRISSGTVIGSAGFGIIPDKDRWARFPQIGRVIIGDRVDIGSNCSIDRGAIDNTVIADGVKLDNLIQIAHNVQIGENTVIAACTGIAGSAKIGKNCQIGGRASIQGHIQIADGVVITTCTFVNKSIHKPAVYSASIAMQENAQWQRNHARLHQLDKTAKKLNTLAKQVERHLNNQGEHRDE